MNSFAGNTASNAAGKPGSGRPVLTLNTSSQMLPLVRRIIKDIVEARANLARLSPELSELNRQRRTLSWPERSRRYLLTEVVATEETHLQQAKTELESLGLSVLDITTNLVGFPTVVNGRAAFFSWLPGEEGLRYWQFEGNPSRHAIPARWWQELSVNLPEKG